MPGIYDNIEQDLLPALAKVMQASDHADFCVGYFNLRGWQKIDEYVERWKGGEGNCCRLLVGMQKLPQAELRSALDPTTTDTRVDNQARHQMRKRIAQEFRDQLTMGAQTNEDEAGLRRLARQIRDKKLVVKLYVQHSLHAKLYLLYRPEDPVSATAGFLGSSNLTLSGLLKQGELNVDVLDQDACEKLAKWFEDRWNEGSVDISDDLLNIIDQSWARETPIPPYHIYIKMAYHLSQEARSGLSEFKIPADFDKELLDFQVAAVKIAAHHLNTRRGVIIGDVVGLGKTLMATALARIFEDDRGMQTLIVCPKNLVPMWESYTRRYKMRGARVMSFGRILNEMPDEMGYGLVIIDESHNFRNRDGKRYRALTDYISRFQCRCVLLSATPYNKTYHDLSNQLRLFIDSDDDLGIRPEELVREVGEGTIGSKWGALPRSIAAFERSEHREDWQNLMRLYLVRRTRNFIMEHYAKKDRGSDRRYLQFGDGTKSYFPKRVPKTVPYNVDDQYAKLFSDELTDAINGLKLPRCGLANYINSSQKATWAVKEKKIIGDLSRAGERLIGFTRIGLYKRLESSGHSFLLSVERHILRNCVFLHAINKNSPLPIGSVEGGLIDLFTSDVDGEGIVGGDFNDDDSLIDEEVTVSSRTIDEYMSQAGELYKRFVDRYESRFRWLDVNRFDERLKQDLKLDTESLIGMLAQRGEWKPAADGKLARLYKLIADDHGKEKVLVFTQFSDTALYLKNGLSNMGVQDIEVITGNTTDPSSIVKSFSPNSSFESRGVQKENQTRVVVATDLLSEGQNLQDCAVVVNYDLPWAIIGLVQRVGRVDRIGQKAQEILCYSFLPVDEVEKIIRLRARVKVRLQQNAELVGADEVFFEDDEESTIRSLYNEKAGILDGYEDLDVDVSSYAYQIWSNAIKQNPEVQKIVEDLPSVVYSSKKNKMSRDVLDGVLVYLRSGHGHDTMAWVDGEGNCITENPMEVLKMAQCEPEEKPVPRHSSHHMWVRRALELLDNEDALIGGALGPITGVRSVLYTRLRDYAHKMENTVHYTSRLVGAIDQVYRFPLLEEAAYSLNRQMKTGISDKELANTVMSYWEDGRLCRTHEEYSRSTPEIRCSLGLLSLKEN